MHESTHAWLRHNTYSVIVYLQCVLEASNFAAAEDSLTRAQTTLRVTLRDLKRL
jgi:hypothetical protein